MPFSVKMPVVQISQQVTIPFLVPLQAMQILQEQGNLSLAKMPEVVVLQETIIHAWEIQREFLMLWAATIYF
jgi:hypothetical protein